MGEAPARRREVAEAWVDDHVILGGEFGGDTLGLDPVSATIWESLDGRLTPGDLAADLVAALGGTHQARLREVTWLLDALGLNGFLDLVDQPVLVPRHLFPKAPPDSCLGRRLGVSHAVMAQVRCAGGTEFRFGSNDEAAVAAIADHIDTVPVTEDDIETFVLRVSRSPRGRPRLQQLFDTLGNTLYAGRDLDEGSEALGRTVSARMHMEGEVWLEASVVHSDELALIVHPAFRQVTVELARPVLARHGLRLAPCGFVQLSGSGEVSVPSEIGDGEGSLRWNFAGVLVPHLPNRVERLRVLLHLARRWDQPHFDLLASVNHDRYMVEIASTATGSELTHAIASACGVPLGGHPPSRGTERPSDPTAASDVTPGEPASPVPESVVGSVDDAHVELVDTGDVDLPKVFRVDSFMSPSDDTLRSVRELLTGMFDRFDTTGPGYNFPVPEGTHEFIDSLYRRFVRLSQQILGPFEVRPPPIAGCWAFCSSRTTRPTLMHSHEKTAHINAVYYVSLPRRSAEEGALTLQDDAGRTYDVYPDVDTLVIFDGATKHRPQLIDSPELRIAVNMEIVVADPQVIKGRFQR